MMSIPLNYIVSVIFIIGSCFSRKSLELSSAVTKKLLCAVMPSKPTPRLTVPRTDNGLPSTPMSLQCKAPKPKSQSVTVVISFQIYV